MPLEVLGIPVICIDLHHPPLECIGGNKGESTELQIYRADQKFTVHAEGHAVGKSVGGGGHRVALP